MASQESPRLHTPVLDAQIIRFDRYQADMRSGELRRDGRKIRLQPQPFQLLALLLRNAGRIVSREELRRELWTEDTFVDFDHRLAAAMNKMREALNDSAEKPRYIETLPKRGYRFIGKIALPTTAQERDAVNKVSTFPGTSEVMIRFDLARGKTLGDSFRVTNFGSPTLMIPNDMDKVGLQLTRDKIMLTLTETSGSIWILNDMDQ